MTAKMGGQDRLQVVLMGSRDLTDIMLSRAEGGRKHDVGLSERVGRASGGNVNVDLVVEERPSMSDYAATLADSDPGTDAPHIVILSLAPDVFTDDANGEPGFLSSAAAAIDGLKAAGSHVLFVNASTIDPALVSSNYHGIDEPFTRKAQRLDLALLQLSISHGISIIDADRVLAELGAREHVRGALDYSQIACEALCEETVRIIEDYGFFEPRPVMAQVGRQNREAS